MEIKNSEKTPAKIILLRHAEKPEDKSNINLAPKGTRRAAALGPYLLENYGLPVAIYAMGQDSSDSSLRPIQTITPTAILANLPIIIQYTRNSYKAMVTEILTKSEYTDNMVFICWEHTELRKIAKHFGVSKDKLYKWKGDDYDHIWELTSTDHGYDFKIIPQRLLYGDS